MPFPDPAMPVYAAHAYDAGDLRVVSGMNHGDTLHEADACEPGDIYRLGGQARARRLLIHGPRCDDGSQTLAPGTEAGQAGDRLTLRRLLTFMAPDGDKVEVLLIDLGAGASQLVVPLSPIGPRIDYTLVQSTPAPSDIRIADIVCTAFTTGTQITRADGRLAPIESLAAGDAILTRDHGPQPVRWIGRARLRALGGFAPVVITAGTLGNHADLVVSPHHRLFIYQRSRQRIGPSAELLVQARHLVNDDTVFRREGGFVDYYSLVFDHHEIVYAEGIPVESMMVTEARLSLLPADLADDIRSRFPGLSQTQHRGTEAGHDGLTVRTRPAPPPKGRVRPS